MAPKFSAHSFTRLFTLLIGILLFWTIIATYAFYAIQQNLLSNSGESLALAATDIADKIDRLILERFEDIDFLAQSLDLQAQGPEHIIRTFQHLKTTHPSFLSLLLVDLHGKLVVSLPKIEMARDVTTLPGLKAIRNGQARHIAVSNSLGEARSGFSLLFARALANSSHGPQGAIVAEVSLSELEQIFSQTQQVMQKSRHTKFPIEWQLLTREGQIILDSILHEEGKVSLMKLDLPSARLVTSGKTGFIEEIHKRRHVPVITGFAQTQEPRGLPHLQWGVLLRIDRDSVLPAIHDKIIKLGMGVALVLIPLVGIIFWTARKAESEHQRVVEAETKYRDIFENAREGIFQTTPSGQFLHANPAMARILGYESPADLIRTMTDLAQQLYVDANQRAVLLQQLEDRGSVEKFEFQFYRRDGMIRWGSGNIRAVKDANGLVRYLEGTVEDITDRKNAETALRHMQEQLLMQQEQKTKDVQAELDKAKAALITQTKLATLGQLAGSIAHELRNPLGTMRNAIFLLKRGSSNHDDRTTRYLEMLEEEVKNSDLIIQGLLEVARGKEPVKQTVSLQWLLEKVLKEHPFPETVSCHFQFEPDPFHLWVDPPQFIQVFRNLLHNACQAMKAQGHIRIQATCDSDAAEIVISDTGPGISEEHREQVFEPLFTTKAKGTGLGLTLCREIIERHGGTIVSSDNPAGGATFHIRLPLYRPNFS